MTRGWNSSAGGQVRELGCSDGEEKLQGDLSVAFQCLKEAKKKDGDRLLSRGCCNRTRGDGFKLKEGDSGWTLLKLLKLLKLLNC